MIRERVFRYACAHCGQQVTDRSPLDGRHSAIVLDFRGGLPLACPHCQQENRLVVTKDGVA